ncbi:hypothetical protein PFISCL1PPCAC_14798, partial [Pristionchus fissidentatus]
LQIIFVVLFGEVINSYFSCVYYRRNLIIPEDARFRFTGWKELCVNLGLRGCGFIVYTIVFFLILEIETPVDEIPISMKWVEKEPSFIVLKVNYYLYALAFVMLVWGMPVFTLISVIIRELSHEIKHGMVHASIATKRLQVTFNYNVTSSVSLF